MGCSNLSVLIPLLRCNIVTNLYLSSPCLENWPSQRTMHHQCTARPVMLHLKLITQWTPTDKLSWPQISLSSLSDMEVFTEQTCLMPRFLSFVFFFAFFILKVQSCYWKKIWKWNVAFIQILMKLMGRWHLLLICSYVSLLNHLIFHNLMFHWFT